MTVGTHVASLDPPVSPAPCDEDQKWANPVPTADKLFSRYNKLIDSYGIVGMAFKLKSRLGQDKFMLMTCEKDVLIKLDMESVKDDDFFNKSPLIKTTLNY